MSDLESLVQMVRNCGLSTGHAESPEQLMQEVLEQVEALRQRIAELEAQLADYHGGAAWIHHWLVAEKYQKPQVPAMVERAKRNYLTALEENKRLREAIEAHRSAVSQVTGRASVRWCATREHDAKLWSVLGDERQ